MLRGDAKARGGPDGATLGHFVVPSSRLGELATSAAELPPSISVILDRHLGRALEAVDDFGLVPIASVDAPEGVNVERGDILETLIGWSTGYGDNCDVYCEVFGPQTRPDQIDETVHRLATIRQTQKNFGAKIPIHGAPTEMIAHTLAECSRLRVPLKLGADETRAVGAHGILNMITAAAIAFRDSDAREAIISALEDEDPGSFTVDDDAFVWRERRFGAATIVSVRRELFVAFAAFDPSRPAAQLREVGVLA
ncbi:MAG TPA: hypothetical protein VMD07_06315 [Candidatus Acidoferrales bacterium]|nr:hypothetical protein [Candidatus Acidoferrales bacterium]